MIEDSKKVKNRIILFKKLANMPPINNSNSQSKQGSSGQGQTNVGYYQPQKLPDYQPQQFQNQGFQGQGISQAVQNRSQSAFQQSSFENTEQGNQNTTTPSQSIPQNFDLDKAQAEEKKLEEDLGLRLPPEILKWRALDKSQKQAFKSQNPKKAAEIQNLMIIWLDLFELIKEAYFWDVIQKKDINGILASFWNFTLKNKLWYLDFLKDLIENKQYGEAILENYYIQKYQEDYLNEVLKQVPVEIHKIFRELYYTYILGEEPDPITLEAANEIKKILTEYNENDQLGKDAFDQIQNYKKSPLNLSGKTNVNATKPISREEILQAMSDSNSK